MNRKLPKKKMPTSRIDPRDAGSTSSTDYDLRITITAYKLTNYRSTDYRSTIYATKDGEDNS